MLFFFGMFKIFPELFGRYGLKHAGRAIYGPTGERCREAQIYLSAYHGRIYFLTKSQRISIFRLSYKAFRVYKDRA